MSRPLRNPKHERFVRAIVIEGRNSADAYVEAGFRPHRANHFRLLRQPRIVARIAQIKEERNTVALAARTPIPDVLTELGKYGFERIADFFESAATGFAVRNELRRIRPEVALALIRSLCEGFGLDHRHISAAGDISDQPPN